MIQYYSHLNGLEFLIVHKPKLWQEILKVIEKVDASITLTKISSEKTKKGKLLYSPSASNSLFKGQLLISKNTSLSLPTPVFTGREVRSLTLPRRSDIVG